MAIQRGQLIRHPRTLDRKYRRSLVKRVNTLVALLHPELMRELRLDPPDTGMRADGLDQLLGIIRRVKAFWFRERAPVPEEIAATGAEIDAAAGRQAVRATTWVDIAGQPLPDRRLIQRWTRDNVRLISSIDERHFTDVEDIILDGFVNQRSFDDIAARLNERTGVSQRRARFIARDQVGTLHSQSIDKKLEDLGVTEYEWVSQRDNLVRDTHEGFDGQIFDARVGSPEGHPGEPIGCRCGRRPVRRR